MKQPHHETDLYKENNFNTLKLVRVTTLNAAFTLKKNPPKKGNRTASVDCILSNMKFYVIASCFRYLFLKPH